MNEDEKEAASRRNRVGKPSRDELRGIGVGNIERKGHEGGNVRRNSIIPG